MNASTFTHCRFRVSCIPGVAIPMAIANEKLIHDACRERVCCLSWRIKPGQEKSYCELKARQWQALLISTFLTGPISLVIGSIFIAIYAKPYSTNWAWNITTAWLCSTIASGCGAFYYHRKSSQPQVLLAAYPPRPNIELRRLLIASQQN